MSEVGAAAGLLVAAVFVWAGLAKFPAADAAGLRALGVPWSGLAARLLPSGELGLAALLIVRPRAGALVALVALGVFSAVVWRAVRTGRNAACGCFGRAGTRPVSGLDLARNGVLGGAAVLTVAVAEPARPGLEALMIVTTAGAVALIALTLAELRSTAGRLWSNERLVP